MHLYTFTSFVSVFSLYFFYYFFNMKSLFYIYIPTLLPMYTHTHTHTHTNTHTHTHTHTHTNIFEPTRVGVCLTVEGTNFYKEDVILARLSEVILSKFIL